MRNKVFLYNFSNLTIEPLVKKFYEVYSFKLPIKTFALYSATSIIVFDDGNLEEKNDFDFFKEVTYLNQEDLNKYEDNLLSLLDDLVGRKRLVNPKQFEIIVGTVVRNKIDPRLGPGVVEDIDGETVTVNFPKAQSLYDTNIVTCLTSNLRVVTHIEEVIHNERKKAN